MLDFPVNRNGRELLLPFSGAAKQTEIEIAGTSSRTIDGWETDSMKTYLRYLYTPQPTWRPHYGKLKYIRTDSEAHELFKEKGRYVWTYSLSSIGGFLRAAYELNVNPLPDLRRRAIFLNNNPGEWKFFHSARDARKELLKRREPFFAWVVQDSNVVVWWPFGHQKKEPKPLYINMD